MQNLPKNDHKWLGITAACFGLTAVALGAFGAHMLKAIVTTERLATWQTAIDYQMFHTIALLLILVLQQQTPSKRLSHIAVCFILGVVIFSGSLYALVLTDTPWLGAITPIGGVLMIAGWALLLWHYLRHYFRN
ncbi:MAG: DUF423 domain-containing protein [Gammaproteobacteria bacterium]|nr:DUF423 domain-containing protein [Gammaproteobacteria bacterium]NNJ72951.1 DUF423 domain-containing protein [Enterobacterales bacterium]